MDTQRVEVLHIADRDAVVEAVPDHLVFNLLPTLERALNEHLIREGEGLGADFQELLLIVHEAGTQASEGVSGAHDERIAELCGGAAGFLYAGSGMALYGLYVDFVKLAHKQVAVFRVHNRLDRGAEHLNSAVLEHVVAVELHTAVERGLAAEGQEYALGALLAYHLLDEICVYRQEVDLDGGDVGVDEHRGDALFAQGLQRLGTRIVKLSGLADLEGA